MEEWNVGILDDWMIGCPHACMPADPFGGLCFWKGLWHTPSLGTGGDDWKKLLIYGNWNNLPKHNQPGFLSRPILVFNLFLSFSFYLI
jgi:hypothetical protein